MPLRKYWIVLLLGLVCQVPWASAQILPENEEALEHKFASSLLSEDLEQQLRSFFTHDLLVQKLLDWAFIRSQPTPYPPVMPTPFLAYKGKRIGRVQLHKQGVCSTKGAWWERLQNYTPHQRLGHLGSAALCRRRQAGGTATHPE